MEFRGLDGFRKGLHKFVEEAQQVATQSLQVVSMLERDCSCWALLVGSPGASG